MVERLHPRIEEVTSRQLEVARLVAEGRTNPEIAAALGITLDGAKYHVSELLGRLGLERREEIRQWYRSERRARRVRGLSALLATAPRAFATAAAVTLVIAVGGLFALGLAGGRAEEGVTPMVTATPTATSPLEPGVVPPVGAVGDASDLPDELDWLPVALGERLRAAPPEVASWERVDWFDGCFDIDVPGGCPLSVSPVPGYRMVMDLDGDEYIARTALKGERYALESAPPLPSFEVVYEWTGYASGGSYPCLQILMDPTGAGTIASCGEAPTPIDIGQTSIGSAGLFEVLAMHLPAHFEALPVDTARFDDPVERAFFVWGRYLAIESYTGRGVGPGTLAIGWHRGESGGCQSAWIERFGVARLSDCPDGERSFILDAEALSRMYAWLDEYAFFRRPDGIVPPGTGDEDYLVVAGSGSSELPEATQDEIEAWIATLAEGGPTASE